MKKLLIAMLALATLAAPIALASPASAVTPRVQLTSSASTVTVGQGFTLTAAAKHAAPHQKAVLQRKVGVNWIKVGVKYLPRKGRVKRVSFSQTLNSTGFAFYRVRLLAKGSYSAATAARSVHVVVHTPLRFNFKGAQGLALRQQGSSARVASGARTADTATGSTSNLSTVSATGTTSNAVVSGSANISHFMIAPDGSVFVAFSTPVELSDTTAFVPFGGGCVLAKVDSATGVPWCIDTSMWSLDWYRTNTNPPIQFDALGGVYYSGSTRTGQRVLRRYANGAATDLMNDNLSLSDFLVLADGTVLVSGYTPSTGAYWTRRISPSGGLQTMLNSQSSFAHMPDGQDYAINGNTVYRYQNDALQVASWSSDPNPCWNLCYDIHTRATTSDGRVFLIGSGGGSNSAQITQIYPTTQPISLTTVQTPTRLTAVGTQVLIAGRNSAGANVVSRYDPATGVETPLTDGAHELEIYHLNALDDTTAMFDGLRFSDNTLVVGKVDVSTGQVTVLNSMTSKWEDFQTF